MSEPLSFLDGKVMLHAGDCVAVMATLAENSIDACVCDPPYHLQSIVKRFSKTGRTDKTRTSSGPPEYQQDIARRMKLELAGPDERARESIKAKLGDKPQDHGPLFGGLPESPGGAERSTANSLWTDNRANRNEKIA